MILTPKNWNSFQHYKERTPAWIKLHKGLLTDFEFVSLPVASKALAPMLWLLASEYESGKIDASLEKIAFRVHMTVADLKEALTPLIDSGFFDASEALAGCKRPASLEKEKKQEVENIEKRESEKRAREDDWPDDYREMFWKLFPNKVGKPKALAKLDLCRRRGVLWRDLIGGLHSYIRDKPPDRQWLNPETFLNQERWNDRPAAIQGTFNGQRTANPRSSGYDAILAASTREAGKIVRDSEMAGAADEAEFPFGDGAFGGRSQGPFGSPRRASADHDGGESGTSHVLEGEIIPPDEASARVSSSGRRH